MAAEQAYLARLKPWLRVPSKPSVDAIIDQQPGSALAKLAPFLHSCSVYKTDTDEWLLVQWLAEMCLWYLTLKTKTQQQHACAMPLDARDVGAFTEKIVYCYPFSWYMYSVPNTICIYSILPPMNCTLPLDSVLHPRQQEKRPLHFDRTE